MEKTDRKYIEKSEVKKERENEYTSFAEQFLERPVCAGVGDLGITVTCCTFRGIPTIDDY